MYTVRIHVHNVVHCTFVGVCSILHMRHHVERPHDGKETHEGTCMALYMYMYSRRHNKVSVPFLLPFRFLVVLPFLLPFVTVYNRSVF